MDQFHTRVSIPSSPVKISYRTRCLFMGSCFSDYIGTLMAGYKFPLLMNPFGTLFNPASIAGNILNLINAKSYTEKDLLFYDGLWLSLDHYTGFSATEIDTCLTAINTGISEASRWLQACDFLVITLGTAWVYRYLETGKIVANCHKIPRSSFSREFLQPEEIREIYHTLIPQLRSFNPSLKIIFTLSPVRHWSDGAVNNQLSKSVLHYSIHEILKDHADTWYFPSYEIFMDELRDYRFYAADMLHPSQQGAGYVWKRFLETWVDESSQQLIPEIEGILKAAGHRPVNPKSKAHAGFREKTIRKATELMQQYPFLDFSREIKILKKTTPP